MSHPTTLKADSPCIGYCSCSFGDKVCLGCGRTQPEVDGWLTMSDEQKKAVWDRLDQADTIKSRQTKIMD